MLLRQRPIVKLSLIENPPLTPAGRFLALALAVLVISGTFAGSAFGKNAEEKLDAVEEKIDTTRQREGVLTRDIESMGNEISALESQVADLRSQEDAAEAELAAKQAELDQAVSQLKVAVGELKVLRGRLRRALNNLRDRLVSIYMSGEPDIASIILAAKDYGDMVAVSQYVAEIQRSDEALAERVRTLRDESKELVTIRRDAKATIESARDRIAAEASRLEATRTTLETREGALVSARAERQTTLESVRSGIHKYEEVASDLRAKIEQEVAGATTGTELPAGPMPTPSTSGFIWPVDGTFTSPFGSRWGSMHEGIDIAAPEGTPIRAAASGTVILMQSEAESGGYGNYTCVDHGGGLSTCYAHQSGFATSSGASVRQGDVIGYVGNTGHSFGAHLHFEVRTSGVAVDPMGYL
ncbi:MAG: peptidoglycan DD-metalloendopeptidase family protein [Solirubrobacterales bacterium]|nr:peptidoglycan DD-metalloendopeptidase family protein [Solirubrobacterales bacterium]